MNKLILGAVAAAGALALAGCETATPYQPLYAAHGQASGGFSEQQVEANRWRVTFAGNSLTSRERVERYLLFRAADITVGQGFDWFTTLDRNTDKKSSFYNTGGGFGYGGGYGGYWGPSWGLYRRGFGWGYGFGGAGRYGGFGYGGGYGGFGGFGPWGGGGFDTQEISRYSASAEIVMGRGPKPAGDPRAFNARSVIDHLRGSIQLPTAG